ncbi:MAG: HNH endonuclease [Caldilineaceae bacterium]|nr:HNH endonuclease [Caldilineaceae bacterium]
MSTRYISAEIRQQVQMQAGYRCGYCQADQRYVLGPLEIDRIIPVAAGGTHDEINLWLACRMWVYHSYRIATQQCNCD